MQRILTTSRIPLISSDLVFSNSLNHLSIETYEASGQLTHPDVVDFGATPFNGYRFWMVNTPYPNEVSGYENPSIWASNDGITWVVPPGLTNPIVAGPGGSKINSDTAMIYDSHLNKLRVYWREYDSVGPSTLIKMIQSSDGVTWTDNQTVINCGTNLRVAPAVYFNPSDNSYIMWLNIYVIGPPTTNGGVVRLTSADGITWAAETTVKIDKAATTNLWHFNIKKMFGRFIGVAASYLTSDTGVKYLLMIDDKYSNGTYFKVTETKKLLDIGSGGAWDATGLYQSCLLPVDGKLYLWYSGINGVAHYLGLAIQPNDAFVRLGLTGLDGTRRKIINHGKSLLFVAANSQYVRIPYKANLNFTSQFTVAVWIKPTIAAATKSVAWIAGSRQSTNKWSFSLGNGKLSFGVWQADNTVKNVNTTLTPLIQAGEWTLVAAVADGTYIHTYMNGKEVGSKTAYNGTIHTSSEDVRIGQADMNAARYFDGNMDDALFWNVGLTPTQVLALYNSRIIPGIGLVCELPCEDGSGNTVVDVSTGGNNGDLTGHAPSFV